MAVNLSRRSALGLMAGAFGAFAFDLPSLCQHAQAIAQGRSPYFFLTQDEAAVLSALVDRIIPADEDPSATEAGVVDFIDLQLATAYGGGAGLYLQGPFNIEAGEEFGYQLPYSPAQLYRRALGAIIDGDASRFVALSDGEKDNFIEGLQKGKRDLNGVPSNVFYKQLRTNAVEGYFADPIYNGNRNYAGWRMVGFPGPEAYYLTEIDRYNMVYWREPKGIGHREGIGVRPFTAQDAPPRNRLPGVAAAPGGG